MTPRLTFPSVTLFCCLPFNLGTKIDLIILKSDKPKRHLTAISSFYPRMLCFTSNWAGFDISAIYSAVWNGNEYLTLWSSDNHSKKQTLFWQPRIKYGSLSELNRQTAWQLSRLEHYTTFNESIYPRVKYVTLCTFWIRYKNAIFPFSTNGQFIEVKFCMRMTLLIQTCF